MVYREVHRVEIREVLRHWQAGHSARAVARSMGLARNTVHKYLKVAKAIGLSQSGPSPTDEQLAQLLTLSDVAAHSRGQGSASLLLAPFQKRIDDWLSQDKLLLTRVHELLAREGCLVSYSSLRRFVANNGLGAQLHSTVRVAPTPPGEVAELDFGRLGYIPDLQSGRKRLVWALVVVLIYSRHMFVWPLFHQRLEDAIEGLEAAWQAFGGVPQRLILDNFPAAVAKADPFSPRLTSGFLEYAQFRHFLPDLARIRHPKDKPHAERSIHYVRERFFKGGDFTSLQDARQQAQYWCLEVAGLRVHGTTRQIPLTVFLNEERAHLLPLESKTFDLPRWTTLRVHPDHHISFKYALYSVPASLCLPDSNVEVRADSKLVRIYLRGTLIKTHPRQPQGGRSTDPDDYPKERAAYALRAPDRMREEASKLGHHIGEFADRLLEGPLPWAKLRLAQKLLRLGDRYSPVRLEAACARALAFDLVDVHRLENILVQALESEALPADQAAQPPTPLPARFARPGAAFSQHSKEDTSYAREF